MNVDWNDYSPQDLVTQLNRLEGRVDDVHRAVLGNGQPERSLLARMVMCEGKLKQVTFAGAAIVGMVLTAAIGVVMAK